MVALNRAAADFIDNDGGFRADGRRFRAFDEMQEHVPALLRVDDFPSLAARGKRSRVADLPAHFRVARRAVENDGDFAFVVNDFENRRFGGKRFVAEKFRCVLRFDFGKRNDLLFLSGASAFPLLGHKRVERVFVHRVAAFPRHEVGEVERESVSIVKQECRFSVENIVQLGADGEEVCERAPEIRERVFIFRRVEHGVRARVKCFNIGARENAARKLGVDGFTEAENEFRDIKCHVIGNFRECCVPAFERFFGKAHCIRNSDTQFLGGIFQRNNFFKNRQPGVERFVKRFFFDANRVAHELAAGTDFREDIAHRFREDIDEFVEKRFLETERAPVADGAAQNAAQNVVAVAVAGSDAVGNGKRKRANVVGNDAEGNVDFFLFVCALRSRGGKRGRVFFAGKFFDFAENRRKDVRFVIGNDAGEISEIFRALNNARGALEAHSGVDVLGGKRRKRAVRIRVKFHEHEVPDFDAKRRAGVNERSRRVALRRKVDVELRARTAGPRVAHHPEIVFFVAVDDVDFRVKPGGGEEFFPRIVGFLVKLGGIALGFVRAINGRVKAFFREFPNLRDQFPSPRDGFFFEIVAVRPVSEHFEKRVVIRVHADVFEVVMLASGANAFLRVCGAMRRIRARNLPEENRHELVHSRIREKEVRRVRHKARRRHDLVLFRFKEIKKRLTNFGGCHNKKF